MIASQLAAEQSVVACSSGARFVQQFAGPKMCFGRYGKVLHVLPGALQKGTSDAINGAWSCLPRHAVFPDLQEH
jgi:hypothetical protein